MIMGGGRRRRRQRTDARIATVGATLVLAWYGGWVWLEFHSSALSPWLREHRWVARGGPAILALAVAAAIAAAGVHAARRRARRRLR
jgi:hypothetical protein